MERGYGVYDDLGHEGFDVAWMGWLGRGVG